MSLDRFVCVHVPVNNISFNKTEWKPSNF